MRSRRLWAPEAAVLEAGKRPSAERLLASYLDQAPEQLVEAYAQQTAAGE